MVEIPDWMKCPICRNPACDGGHPYAPLTPKVAIHAVEAMLGMLELRSDDTIRDFIKHNSGWNELAPKAQGWQYADYHRVLRRLIALMGRAQITLWRRDMINSALSGSDLFWEAPLDPTLFTPANQLWIPDRDYFLSDEECSVLRVPPHSNHFATCLILSGDMLFVFLIIGMPVDDPTLHLTNPFQNEKYLLGEQFFRIRGYNYKVGDPVKSAVLQAIVAMASFMKQPVVTLETHHLERSERRRLVREGKPQPPEVRVITLRRLQHAKSSTGEAVDWSHRWWVTGHWRNQWYASEQTHRPVFIHSYVKGPDDKPLAMPTKNIYVVRR